MGIFTKLKGALGARADAALDRAIDPAKELDLKIAELDRGVQQALRELLAYKTNAKAMEADLAREAERVRKAEERAMLAVKAGDDALARACLKDRLEAERQHAAIARDRDEMASHAIKLNGSRKVLETKLRMLKLRKGTLATQLAAARSGTGNPLGVDDALFDELAAVEESIDREAVLAEVEQALAAEDGAARGDGGVPAAGEAPLPAAAADDPLVALKEKMAIGRPALPEGEPEA